MEPSAVLPFSGWSGQPILLGKRLPGHFKQPEQSVNLVVNS